MQAFDNGARNKDLMSAFESASTDFRAYNVKACMYELEYQYLLSFYKQFTMIASVITILERENNVLVCFFCSTKERILVFCCNSFRLPGRATI